MLSVASWSSRYRQLLNEERHVSTSTHHKDARRRRRGPEKVRGKGGGQMLDGGSRDDGELLRRARSAPCVWMGQRHWRIRRPHPPSLLRVVSFQSFTWCPSSDAPSLSLYGPYRIWQYHLPAPHHPVSNTRFGLCAASVLATVDCDTSQHPVSNTRSAPPPSTVYESLYCSHSGVI